MQFDAILTQKSIPIEKIRSKGKTGKDLNHAAHALSLFFSLGAGRRPTHARRGPASGAQAAFATILAESGGNPPVKSVPMEASAKETHSAAATRRFGKKYNEWWSLERTVSPEWDEVIINRLSREIKARHYSRRTRKAYAD